jgi:DNA-binding MarR family transcriptional regulator
MAAMHSDSVERARLTQEARRLIERAARALDGRNVAAWVELNLRVGQLKSLLLVHSTGGMSVKQLAGILGVASPNVTRIVDGLVEQGLVRREENPQDRRMLVITATEKGGALIGDLRESVLTQFARLMEDLSTEELSAFSQSMVPLVRAAEARRQENRGVSGMSPVAGGYRRREENR